MRVAAMGDIHVRDTSKGEFAKLFEEISQNADVLVLCGDLTDLGLPEQAEILAEELFHCTIPILGVLGNHDFASEKQDEVKKILHNTGRIQILDEDPVILNGVGFAGTKGFAGGFDSHMLGPFGEKSIHDFVYEAIDEALILEHSLMQIEEEKKVVVLHYSPIKETVVGEAIEIYPFLGSSRLVEPIERFEVTAVFHAHAHHGSLEGKTQKGIPVYNCAYPLMQKINPKKLYCLLEI